MTLTDVQVAEINQLLLGTERLEGTINGTAHMTGDVTDPHVDADLRVMSGRVADVPFESLAGTVAYEDRLARVNVTLQESAANRLTVSWRRAHDDRGRAGPARPDGQRVGRRPGTDSGPDRRDRRRDGDRSDRPARGGHVRES